ncbi:hypothetical protein [Microbispora triticiradicis]|uniref:hypothetical protein n=1 Tax=Microbispora triticiradicis TaxID=2200763 RepID=UPI001AD7615B|nr:hypothetical protein [Microbispora triticiradicis]MBO4272367.1 hypothetical protein [Microbispora triticiradicis]
MQTTTNEALAQVALTIFNTIEKHAPAIARDIAQSLNGLDRQAIDRATDIDWIANADRAEGSGQPYTEPYIAIYRAMRAALGLPVEH